MVMRVSENMKLHTIVDNMFKTQDEYNQLMEKIASQKMINRPSDDPAGINKMLGFRESKASVTQYGRNIDNCESWLTITESILSSAGDLLVKARETAVAQSTATASAETRSIEAGTIQQLIDEMLTLANTKYRDRYLFSGTKSQEAPFSSSGRDAGEIGDPVAADGNGFNGSVAKAGTYTGSQNKTYVVEIVTGGTLADATYRVSADGGKSWGAPQNDLDGGTVTPGEGIELEFTDDGGTPLTAGDIFYVHASVEGYYNGNGDELSVNIGEAMPFDYSISGEAAFTDRGEGNVDIFRVLNELQSALESNDADGIASQLDDLEAASDQITKNISTCGTRMNRLEIANNTLADLEMDLADLIAGVEDADMTEMITQFARKEVVLQASYAAASEIGKLTILDFL